MSKVFYIKQLYAGYFKELDVESCNSEDANLTEYIYFESEDEAKKILSKMKKFIRDNYKRANDEDWFNEAEQ